MPSTVHGDPSLPAVVRQALEASAAGDGEGAIRLLRLAADEQPGSALPQFLLGAELAQAGDMAGAESAFANAVLLAPEFHIARFQLGLLQFTSGRAALALVTWQPIFGLDALEPLRSFVMGFAELAQDRFEEARRLFGEGIELNTSNAPLNVDMRKVLQRIEALQQPDRSAVNDAQTPETVSSDSAHVLLSNYRAQGPLN